MKREPNRGAENRRSQTSLKRPLQVWAMWGIPCFESMQSSKGRKKSSRQNRRNRVSKTKSCQRIAVQPPIKVRISGNIKICNEKFPLNPRAPHTHTNSHSATHSYQLTHSNSHTPTHSETVPAPLPLERLLKLLKLEVLSAR